MTQSWLLTVSSGLGPVEVRWFVRMLADTLQRELPAHGVAVESAVVHGQEDQPSSVDLAIVAEHAALTDLVGTHVLIQSSPRRGKHSRKRWYVGVSVAERWPTAPVQVQPEDVTFETCRASGAGGQHVNKTESAVRALHVPSGLRVRVESERSQLRNKQRALETIAQLLAAQTLTDAARSEHERRYRSLQVERGRPVARWCARAGTLVRD